MLIESRVFQLIFSPLIFHYVCHRWDFHEQAIDPHLIYALESKREIWSPHPLGFHVPPHMTG